MDKKKSVIENFAFNYFQRLSNSRLQNSDEVYLLNQKEVRTIRRIRINSITLAAITGALGVILLYIPIHFFPWLFPDYQVYIPWIVKDYVSIPIITTIYGLILVVWELWILTWLNLVAVHKIAQICDFPKLNDPLYNRHIEDLFEVAMEKPEKDMLVLGINPYQGMSKLNIGLFMLLNQMKATLSNIVVKMVFRRFLGRYVFRLWIDLAGIPVFAFWNAWATNKIIKEAKVRIMAPGLISILTQKLFEKYSTNNVFRDYIYDTVQYVAVSKRNFHHNHYLLAFSIISTFNIEIKKDYILDKDKLFNSLKELDNETLDGLLKVLVFGIIIDGDLSLREISGLNELIQNEVLDINIELVKKWSISFNEGRGLEELFTAKLAL